MDLFGITGTPHARDGAAGSTPRTSLGKIGIILGLQNSGAFSTPGRRERFLSLGNSDRWLTL